MLPPGLDHALRFVLRSGYRWVARVVLRHTSAPARIEHTQDHFVLRMPKLFHAIGLLFLLLSVYLLWQVLPVNDLTPFAIAICIGLTWIGLRFFLLDGINQHVLFNSDRFYVTNRSGKATAHTWSQVRIVSSSGSSAILEITFADGSKVRISQYLLGMRTFLEYLEERTGVHLMHGSQPVIWWAASKPRS
jgi:hypothetical protein